MHRLQASKIRGDEAKPEVKHWRWRSKCFILLRSRGWWQIPWAVQRAYLRLAPDWAATTGDIPPAPTMLGGPVPPWEAKAQIKTVICMQRHREYLFSFLSFPLQEQKICESTPSPVYWLEEQPGQNSFHPVLFVNTGDTSWWARHPELPS